ncbi:hypothetical protein PG996_003885, partial [Apiospora saccharicola]
MASSLSTAGNGENKNQGALDMTATCSTVPRRPPFCSPGRPRQAEVESKLEPYDASLISVWHPHEFLPEDYPDLDPAYAVRDPGNPPRISPHIPIEAWLPSEIYREPTGTSVIEPGFVRDENGRTYSGYRQGQYMLPNDPAEQDRLDLQHFGLKTLHGGHGLFLTPLQDPRQVLDIATGTGIWPNEFAELFPNAKVVGTGLSQIQPENSHPNVTFVREDSEEEWCHEVPLNFIHARAVMSCFDNPAIHAYLP